MNEPRTYLYVPAHRPERFAKAVASGADAVIIDLEDAVPISEKEQALTATVELLSGAHRAWVRINTGSQGREDLAAIAAAPGLAGVVVPKASIEGLAELGNLAPAIPRCALIETAVALDSASAIAGASGVERVAIGEVDLAADLRLGADPLPELIWALRSRVVVAAAAAIIQPPIGPVHVDIGDLDGLRSSTDDLRRAGFWSRQVIHPSQVPVVHEVLTPTAEEMARAADLIELAATVHGGVFTDGAGRMVDEAVLRSARHLLSIGTDT